MGILLEKIELLFRKKLEEIDSNNLQAEYSKQKNVQDIHNHTVDVNTVDGAAPNPEMLNGENLDDVSGVQDSNTNTTEAPALEEPTEDSAKDKYFKDYMKDKLIKKVTEKDPKDELVDMAMKGVGGAIGAIPGAMAGVFAAGLTGGDTSKAALTGAMGGANIGSGVGGTINARGDTVFNNNVKVLVKDGKMENAGIIENTAQIATQRSWSQGKMMAVGQMAEKYPNLKADKEAQKEIKKIMQEQGVAEKKLQQVIDDIIKVQKGVEKADNKLTKNAGKNMEKWK